MLNVCSAKFDFISGCVSAFICSVYRVLKDLVIGTDVAFKFVNTCGCVFFMYGVVCGFVCEVSFEGVVCGVCYVVFQFLDSFSYFMCGIVVMC